MLKILRISFMYTFWTWEHSFQHFLRLTLTFRISFFFCHLWKKIMEFLKRITAVDKTLIIFGIDPAYSAAYREHMRIVLVWCSIAFLLIFINAIVYYSGDYNIFDSLIRSCTYELPFIMNSIDELNFAVMIS